MGSGGSAIAVCEVEGMRSLFGKLSDAIAVSLCSLCLRGPLKKDVWGVEGVRSLFGKWGGWVRSWGVEGVRSLFGSWGDCHPGLDSEGVRSLAGEKREWRYWWRGNGGVTGTL